MAERGIAYVIDLRPKNDLGAFQADLLANVTSNQLVIACQYLDLDTVIVQRADRFGCRLQRLVGKRQKAGKGEVIFVRGAEGGVLSTCVYN